MLQLHNIRKSDEQVTLQMAADSRKLSVGVAGLRGIPGVMGGVESHCEEILPRIVARDPAIRIRCIARRPYVRSGRPYSAAGVEVVPLPSTRKASVEAILNTFCAVLYFGLRRRPDLLHIHAIGPALMTLPAKLLGLKVIVTHHGRDYQRAKWKGFAKWVLRTGERSALRRADMVIAVAESLAQELRAEFPERAQRIHYIPNGVPANGAMADAEADALMARLGLRAGAFILSVGRLVPEKGFQDLIAAHERSGSNLPLVIIGGADHETDFVRSLYAKRSERLIFTGMMPREDVLTCYAKAAGFVLASHHEGLPIVALEAAASGAPLLLSDIMANRDLKLSARHYFPVGDVDALAARLAQGFEGLADENADVVARFDWDRIAQQTHALYRQLAG